jgi:hypothetical protein
MMVSSAYAKALLAIVFSTAGALVTALGTSPQQNLSHLSTTDWLLAAGTILGSGGLVWLTQNVPGVLGGAIKSIVAFLSAGVASLVVALSDNIITQGEWITAFSAAVVATGFVYQVANKPTPPVA